MTIVTRKLEAPVKCTDEGEDESTVTKLQVFDVVKQSEGGVRINFCAFARHCAGVSLGLMTPLKVLPAAEAW